MAKEIAVETDVLVIGGGMAGLFAAIKARETGVKVAVADKGFAGRSGSSPYAFWYTVFDSGQGHSLSDWMNHVNVTGEYMNNREWTEIVFRESNERFRDLLSWGVEFEKEADGNIHFYGFPGLASRSCRLKKRVFGETIRSYAKNAGVQFFDRVMLTDLIKSDGSVRGAMGFEIENGELYVFSAKAVILCTGCSSYKPDGWPVAELTGDGEAMAFRAGAVIGGKEFNEIKYTDAAYPAANFCLFLWEKEEEKLINCKITVPPQCRTFKGINAEGMEITGPAGSNFMELEFEAHAGKAPVYWKEFGLSGKDKLCKMTGAAALGMNVHTTGGVWPKSMKCDTNVPGLYVAGDSCASMQSGAVYPGVGYAIAGASVTGTRAGLSAAEYAGNILLKKIYPDDYKRFKGELYALMERKAGFSARWVIQVLRSTLIPYYILYVKHEARMKAALTLVEFMRDNLLPKITAGDTHELRLAIEAKHMIFNAEVQLRSSLFRTESRGTHYREDYPRRDDPEWLVWTVLENREGRIIPAKRPIPREWWPDLTVPYKKRYLNRYPGE